mmetsp:Transcript_19753/g.54381  ORF Transcript_19753/g.54381 Transcript_19753/m.54381 type:complete len:332 (-) Transcript_19753:445-1440(-)
MDALHLLPDRVGQPSDLLRGRAGGVRHERDAGVTAPRDEGVEGQLEDVVDAEGLRDVPPRGRSPEGVLPLPVGQRQVAHVLHDGHGWHGQLAEHGDAALHVDGAQLLRSGDDDRRRDLTDLRDREVYVPGARRHVQHQVVELAPVCLVEKLGDEPRHHGATHHSGFARVPEGHELDPGLGVDRWPYMFLLRLVLVHLHAGGLVEVDHDRQGRPEHVAVEDADFRAALPEFEGKVDSDGALTHAALARGHRDDAFHLVQRRWHLRHRPGWAAPLRRRGWPLWRRRRSLGGHDVDVDALHPRQRGHGRSCAFLEKGHFEVEGHATGFAVRFHF